MSHLHTITHWLHGQPVAHIAWACTVIVAVVALLALRGPFRRLRLAGNRAALRIIFLLTLMALAAGAEAALDDGYRLHLGQAQASVIQTEYGQVLAASSPFPATDYYNFEMIVARNQLIDGTIPELRVTASWSDSLAGSSFTAPLVGLPEKPGQTFLSRRQLSPRLQGILKYWQSAIDRTPAGHVYVDATAASRFGVRKGDVLATRIAGQAEYPTVSGILPSGQLAGPGPAIIVPLSEAQQITGFTGHVSRVLVFFTASDQSEAASARAAITSSAPNLAGARPAGNLPSFQTILKTTNPGDANRWLAVGGAALAALAALCLGVLGRRSLTRKDRSRFSARVH